MELKESEASFPKYQKPVRVLRMPEMMEKLGLSKATIQRMDRDGRDGFPKSRKITMRNIGWIESEVDEWIMSREKSC